MACLQTWVDPLPALKVIQITIKDRSFLQKRIVYRNGFSADVEQKNLRKFWTIPQNSWNIEVILFLIALLKAVICLLNCQNNFKSSRGRRVKIYFCQLIGHFPMDRTISLIYLTAHKEVLATFSEWLYILMYFSFYSSASGNCYVFHKTDVQKYIIATS